MLWVNLVLAAENPQALLAPGTRWAGARKASHALLCDGAAARLRFSSHSSLVQGLAIVLVVPNTASGCVCNLSKGGMDEANQMNFHLQSRSRPEPTFSKTKGNCPQSLWYASSVA